MYNMNTYLWENSGEIAILFLIIGTLIFTLHFLPSFFAFARQHPFRVPILLLNILLGWTVIGWVLLFLWAISEPPPKRRRVVVRTYSVPRYHGFHA
jgi:hypothetical protein